MDVAAWLHAVEIAGEEGSHESSHVSHQFAGEVADRDHHNELRLRRRDDSSLIGARDFEAEGAPLERPPLRKRRRKRSLTSRAAISSEGSYSWASSTSDDQEPRETFERRPRHKTRADLYEPGSNARTRRSRPKKTSKGRKEERYHRTVKPQKLHRAGENMLNKFSADNVPSERLTVSRRSAQSTGSLC